MIKLILPIPSSELAANRAKGKHWSQGYSLRKKARQDGFWIAQEALKRNTAIYDKLDSLELNIVVYNQSKIRLDIDNLILGIKNYQDGIFDALRGKSPTINDKNITHMHIDVSNLDSSNPRIEWSLNLKRINNEN